MEEKKIDFEQELKRLDEIVNKISKETLSLEDSLSLYEEGTKIIKELEVVLQESQEKIEKIVDIKEN